MTAIHPRLLDSSDESGPADGRHQFGGQWPPQLFHMKEDPWELHDIAAANPAIVARLTALLETVMDPQAIVSPSLVLL